MILNSLWADGRVITIHNNPENMKLPAKFKHLRLQLADVDTQDISKYFAPSYAFIEEARAANEGAQPFASRSCTVKAGNNRVRVSDQSSHATKHCSSALPKPPICMFDAYLQGLSSASHHCLRGWVLCLRLVVDG